jgi:hypothetical protein
MKATRQLLSLCLVIGMTTLSYYAVTLSMGAAKGTTSTFSVIHSTKIISYISGSGNTFLSINSNTTTTTFCIGIKSIFENNQAPLLTGYQRQQKPEITS